MAFRDTLVALSNNAKDIVAMLDKQHVDAQPFDERSMRLNCAALQTNFAEVQGTLRSLLMEHEDEHATPPEAA